MNAVTPTLMEADGADRMFLAIEIAAEHVDYCLARDQTALAIARAIFGPHWSDTFTPTRGQLVEAYARAWLKLGVG